jgi:hypothetical protein
VVITDATTNNCADDLLLGLANGGAEGPGSGDAVNIAAATPAEVVAAIVARANSHWSAEVSGNHVVIFSTSAGVQSRLLMSAMSGVNGALGIVSPDAYGAQGLDFGGDMADADYFVLATLNGTAQADLAGKGLSITDKTTLGFNVQCEDADAADYVDLLILGTPA